MELHTSTGSEDADLVAGVAVAAISQALPGRVRCVLVIGSRADNSASPGSDLDLVVWLRGSATPHEVEVAENAGRTAVAGIGGPVLDLTVAGELDKTWEKSNVLKCSKVVAGEDVRAALPDLPDIDDAYIAETIDWSLRMQRETVRPTGPLSLPLSPPDPEDSMLGYVLHTEDGRPTTRPWVSLVGTIAAFRIHIAARAHVLSKTYALEEYGNPVGDHWGDFVHDVHSLVRRRWNYDMPSADRDRDALRALCRDMIAFENDSYTVGRQWLATVQREPGDAGVAAARTLRRVGWD